MLSLFDDYPIHQTPDPVAMPSTGDRDFYERYWFNGYNLDGDLYLGIGIGRYPHLGIQDGAISVVHEGTQYSFHVSGRATTEPADTTIGPMRLEIVEPMHSCRVTIDDNNTGVSADLLFEGRTANIEEPRHSIAGGSRRIMDTTRFAQLGFWSGWIQIGGRRIELDRETMRGTKDRSWGVRPIGGGDPRGAPSPDRSGGIFFLWAPLHWGDMGSHFQLFEDRYGRPLYQVGAFLPVYSSTDDLPGVLDEATEHMRSLEHDLKFESDSRMIASAKLSMTSVDTDMVHQIELEKLFTFRMKGIGYAHPEWSHGVWKGELEMAAEQWDLDDVDENEYTNQHVQHLVRATMGERIGIGVLEQNCLGPYKPYGFGDFLERT